MAIGNLDRRVQFLRADTSDDGFTEVEGDFVALGDPVWASKTDIKDDERWRAGEVGASITSRFVIHSSQFSRALTPKDRLQCDGVTYGVSGIKETGGRRKYLEITASARADK